MPTASRPARPSCHFCGKTPNGPMLNAPHWTGSADRDEALGEPDGWLRVDVCQVGNCRDNLRSFPRRPRKPRTVRQPRPLYGDFAQLAQWHGVATDGSGRVNR